MKPDLEFFAGMGKVSQGFDLCWVIERGHDCNWCHFDSRTSVLNEGASGRRKTDFTGPEIKYFGSGLACRVP
ncbi:MAG: hypothetical protein IPL46_13365 [Saprospiraceae bacterium]|nr:hypothetical protein [Saprospiraceae bacterium]